MIRGIGVSPGVARGKAFVVACTDRTAAPRRTIDPSAVEAELARFEAALERAEQELAALRKSVGERIGAGEADIFAAQKLVLRDASFHAQTVAIVRDKRVNVEEALSEVIDKFTRAFDAIPDPYLRERAADIRDVGRRVLSALVEGQGAEAVEFPLGSVLIADELLPSATARLELGRVRGVVTERGGKHSHSAILARSLGIPSVASAPNASIAVKTGDEVIVDGVSGVVFINPDAQVKAEYAQLEADLLAYHEGLTQLIDLPAVTVDGTEIKLLANVGKIADTEAALLYKADGIGLYRTEFSFWVRSSMPSEDEQHEILEQVAERFHPGRVTFRVLDIGGDKPLPYMPLPPSRNPSLAQRGIRLLLGHPQILKTQLRAFLRVSAKHPVSILLPFVAGVEDVRETRALLERAKSELAEEGVDFDPNVPLGSMIEVPSAALLARSLARESDFLSLGTNDLVQYLLAADREDESVAPYYNPLHPSVLNLIQQVASAANDAECPLTICGEMAGEPLHAELLIGLGLRHFSVAPGEMLAVKDAIRKVHCDNARRIASHALGSSTATEVESLLLTRPSTPPRRV